MKETMFGRRLHLEFPFYNIVKKGNNKFDIEVALADYDKKDILVE